MASQNATHAAGSPAKHGTARQTSVADTHAVTQRLQSELMSLMSNADPGVSAFPAGDSLFSWLGTVKGPAGTAYEGHTYKLSLKFPHDYPFKAPTVKFETLCWHPNVEDGTGTICLDILKARQIAAETWSAAYSVRTVLLSIQSLLEEPNNDSPLNVDAAKMWSNQPEFKKAAQRKYAQSQQQKPQ
eukprot:jgi/Astpho2/2173/Aster-03165